MRFHFLDPVVGSGDSLFSAVYDGGNVAEYSFVKSNSENVVICYDVLKLFPYVNDDIFCKDIKVIYELLGYKFENFIDLSLKAIGRQKTQEYINLSEKLNAHIKSYECCKINICQYSIFNLFPEKLIVDFYKQRALICGQLYVKALKNLEVFDFYKSFYPILKTFHVISKSPISVNLEAIKKETNHFADLFRKKCKDGQCYLKFHPVGAKTGRVSFQKGSVNPYIIPKDLRKAIVSPYDFKLIQIDFKSFQPRLAIFSTEDKSFKKKFDGIEDIYSVFAGDREKNKISFISWMFSNNRNELFEKEAKAIMELRNSLHCQAIKSRILVNKFGRPLYYNNEEENVVFQNYITSLEVDSVLTLMYEINTLLKDKQSKIILPFHDSLVFYIHNDEMFLLDIIKEKMQNHHMVRFGSSFPVSVKIGNDFLNMEEI